MVALDIAGPPWPYRWPDKRRPAGWGENHTDCNCGRAHGVTDLDLLDILTNDAGLEQDRAAALLWDERTPVETRMIWQIRAELYAAFPWLSSEVVFA